MIFREPDFSDITFDLEGAEWLVQVSWLCIWHKKSPMGFINTACNTPLLLIQGSDMRGWTHLIDGTSVFVTWVEGEQFPRNHFNIVNAIAKSTCHVCIYMYTRCISLYFNITVDLVYCNVYQYIDGNFQAYGCYESQAYLTNIYIYFYIFCV